MHVDIVRNDWTLRLQVRVAQVDEQLRCQEFSAAHYARIVQGEVDAGVPLEELWEHISSPYVFATKAHVVCPFADSTAVPMKFTRVDGPFSLGEI